jgi:hypothetical protein
MKLTTDKEPVQAFVIAFAQLQQIRKTFHGDYVYLYNKFVELNEEEGMQGLTIERQHLTRNMVRAFFATVEGVTFNMKQVALTLPREDCPFSEAERFILREQSVVLTSKGGADTPKTFLKTKDNFRFAYRMMEKTFDLDENKIFDTHHWESFGIALHVRDRLTHPKSHDSLYISIDEMMHFANTTNWFHGEFNKLFDRASESLNEAMAKQGIA